MNHGDQSSRDTAVREARLRRAARKLGLALRKWRGRNSASPLYGTYMLVDLTDDFIVFGHLHSGFGMSLDDIEERLCEHTTSQVVACDDAHERLAGALGATSWSLSDVVPAMRPGDFEVVEWDEEFETRITLLAEGVACRTVVRHTTGELFESAVFPVPADYGEIHFRSND